MNTITARELKRMWDRGEDFLLVNSLPSEMFAETKVLGAVNVPEKEDEFADRVLQKAGSTEKTVVVYCASESCDSAEKAGNKLEAAGFQDVWHFAGGAEEWKAFGEENRTPGRRQREVGKKP